TSDTTLLYDIILKSVIPFLFIDYIGLISCKIKEGGIIMWAYMTTGTTHFLKSIVDTHPDKNFYFMKSGGSTLVYYEDSRKKGIFVSGRSYDILYSFGTIHLTGFAVMQHIPVMAEEAPVFEERTKT